MKQGFTTLPRDHPRVCGEHAENDQLFLADSGSSPRMRGTLRDAPWVAKGIGIIPAYAGNTLAMAILQALRRDHPRVCGEHEPVTPIFSHFPGSSPRMRGTRFGLSLKVLSDGIIPAYAGNTGNRRHRCYRWWDHPRVCGEHSCSWTPAATSTGSSPRMRGTLDQTGACDVAPGIIPAYAGNTAWLLPASFLVWDHPRVCGEHRCEGT